MLRALVVTAVSAVFFPTTAVGDVCPELEVMDVAVMRASVDDGQGTHYQNLSPVEILQGEYGVFEAEAVATIAESGQEARVTYRVDANPSLIVIQLGASVYAEPDADPNALTMASYDPNDLHVRLKPRIVEPLAADVTVSVFTIVWPRGGTGSMQGAVMDLALTDLNGAPLRLTEQQTFEVAQGEEVPLRSVIDSLGVNLTLTGSGTASGTSLVVISTGCEHPPSPSFPGGEAYADSLYPHADDEPPPPSPNPEDDDCAGNRAPPAPVGPTSVGPGIHFSMNTGRLWADFPVVRAWAGGQPSIDLRLVHRRAVGRLWSTNYEWQIWAPCTEEGVMPDRAKVYNPGTRRHGVGHYDWATYDFTWTGGEYEPRKPTAWSLSYPDDGVYVMTHLNGTRMKFSRRPCEDIGHSALYQLVEIKNRQGRVTRLEYDDDTPALVNIMDPWGRTVELENNGQTPPLNYPGYTEIRDPTGALTLLSDAVWPDPPGFCDPNTGPWCRVMTLTDPESHEAKFGYVINESTGIQAIALEALKNGKAFGPSTLCGEGWCVYAICAYPEYQDVSNTGAPEGMWEIDTDTYNLWGYYKHCADGVCWWRQEWGWITLDDDEGRIVKYFKDNRQAITKVKVANSDGQGETIVWQMDYDRDLLRPTLIINGGVDFRYEWNEDRLMTKIVLPFGQGSWQYEYDHDPNVPHDMRGLMTKKIEPDGDEWNFEYYGHNAGTKRGLLHRVIDPDQQVTTYDYGYYGPRQGISDPNAPDLPGRPEWKTRTDPDGVVTRWDYSLDGNITSIVVSQNGTEIHRTEFSDYTALGLPQRREVYRGADTVVTTYTYDALGRLTSVTVDPAPGLNLVTTYEYDGHGLLTKVTDPEGVVTEYTYDHRLRVQQKQVTADQVVLTTVFNYDGDRLTSVEESGQRVTMLEYNDPRGRLTRIIDPEGYHTDLEYYDHTARSLIGGRDLVRRITRSFDAGADPNAYVAEYDYDEFMRPMTRTVDPNGAALLTEWRYEQPSCGCGDATPGENLVHRIEDPAGKVTYLYYDALDRLEKVVRKVGDDADNGGDADDAVTQLVRDVMGFVTDTMDPDGVRVTWNYDWQQRQITRTIDPGGANLAAVFDFDMTGNVVGVTMPNGHSYTLQFDKADRLQRVFDSLGDVALYEYDGLGRVTKRTDGEGHTWEYVRHPIGWIETIKDPIIETPDKVTTLGYDAAGNLEWLVDNEGRRSEYAYDGLDRLTSITEDKDTGSGGIEAVTSFAYNGLGQLIRLTDSDGNYTDYAYDRAGRLTSITLPDTGVISFDYTDWLNALKIYRTDQRQITTTFILNDLYQLTSRSYDNGEPADSFTWTKAGRLTDATRAGVATTTFGWDGAGRVDLATVAFAGLQLPTYQVDPVYVVDPLSVLDERAVGYPDPLSGLPNGLSITHAWDARGRLGRVAQAGVGDVASFGYDPADRLVSAGLANQVGSAYNYDDNDRLTGLAHTRSGGPTLFDKSFG